MRIPLTNNEAIKRFKKIHNNKYDYSKVNYINNDIKIIIICEKHGEFTQTPSDHMKGHGCKKCSDDKKTYSIDNFIKKSRDIHGYKYDYKKSIYTKCNNKIIITCNVHGDFLQAPRKHLIGHGCPSCGGSVRLSNDVFIKKAKNIHGSKYSYSKVEYKNTYKHIIIMCKKHGAFMQIPNSHLNGAGCPKCNSSKGELLIEKWLLDNNIAYEQHKKLLGCKNKRPLFFDFYIKDMSTCIEFDGLQHFKPTGFGSKKYQIDRFESIVKNDQIKNEYCLNNNIKLIRINYLNIKNINKILSKYLKGEE